MFRQAMLVLVNMSGRSSSIALLMTVDGGWRSGGGSCAVVLVVPLAVYGGGAPFGVSFPLRFILQIGSLHEDYRISEPTLGKSVSILRTSPTMEEQRRREYDVCIGRAVLWP